MRTMKEKAKPIYLRPDVHQRVKVAAAQTDASMQEWLERAVLKALAEARRGNVRSANTQ